MEDEVQQVESRKMGVVSGSGTGMQSILPCMYENVITCMLTLYVNSNFLVKILNDLLCDVLFRAV